MRKFVVLPLILTLLILFSSAVWAVVPTPGNSFRGLFSFFTGIFTGHATIEDAYLISFILYFVIFLAIFMEGISRVKIFGAQGQINRYGKAFAIAAAAMATIALFIVEQSTHMTTAERISYLIAPFGIWGGLILAAIIAFITFMFIRDLEALSNSLMLAIAVSAAVGITFAGFLLTMDNLVGWGFLILIISFLVAAAIALWNKWAEGSPQRKAETEREVQRFKEEDQTREEKAKAEVLKRKKKILTAPLESKVVKALNLIKELEDRLNQGEEKKIKKVVSELEKARMEAIHSVRLLHGKLEGEDQERINQISASLQSAKGFLEHAKSLNFTNNPPAITWMNDNLGQFDGFLGSALKVIRNINK